MVCQMESKTFGTDIIGITIWKNELIRCIEFNTFFLDVHFYADTLGELKIIFGTLNRLYFKIAIEIKSD
mgnify:FL=1